MASITFATRTNFNTAAVKAKIEAVVAEKARASCEEAGKFAVRLIALEAATSTKPRAPARSRSKSLTSASSYDYDVTRQANGARLNIHIVGDELFKAKFFSVNYGSQPHEILPHGSYKLVFPYPTEGSPKRGFRRVDHPGTTGKHFYEAAIEAAIALIPTLLQ